MHFYDYMVSFLLAFDKRFRVRVRIPIPNNALNGYGFHLYCIHKRCIDWSLVHLVTNCARAYMAIYMHVCVLIYKKGVDYLCSYITHLKKFILGIVTSLHHPPLSKGHVHMSVIHCISITLRQTSCSWWVPSDCQRCWLGVAICISKAYCGTC